MSCVPLFVLSSISARGGDPDRDSTRGGGAGTVYIRDTDEPQGILIIDAGVGQQPSRGLTLLGSPDEETFTVDDAIVVRGMRTNLLPEHAGITFEFANDVSILDEGVFTIDASANAQGMVTIQNGGAFDGDGDLTITGTATLVASGTVSVDIINAGRVRVAALGGMLTIAGDYRQTDDGTLEIEIAGINESEIGRLAVSGETELAGTLQVVFQQFTPAVDDVFDVLSYNTLTGEFLDIDGGNITFAGDYGADGLTLRTIAAANAALARAIATGPANVDVEVPAAPLSREKESDGSRRVIFALPHADLVDLVMARNGTLRGRFESVDGDGDDLDIDELNTTLFDLAKSRERNVFIA